MSSPARPVGSNPANNVQAPIVNPVSTPTATNRGPAPGDRDTISTPTTCTVSLCKSIGNGISWVASTVSSLVTKILGLAKTCLSYMPIIGSCFKDKAPPAIPPANNPPANPTASNDAAREVGGTPSQIAVAMFAANLDAFDRALVGSDEENASIDAMVGNMSQAVVEDRLMLFRDALRNSSLTHSHLRRLYDCLSEQDKTRFKQAIYDVEGNDILTNADGSRVDHRPIGDYVVANCLENQRAFDAACRLVPYQEEEVLEQCVEEDMPPLE